MSEIHVDGNLKGKEDIVNNDSNENKATRKKESIKSTNSLSIRIIKGPLSWIISAIIVGFLCAAYQPFENWADNIVEPKQENTVSNTLAEQIDSLHVGVLTIAFPKNWQILSGYEAKQTKAEIDRGIQQWVEQYKSKSGIETGDYGIVEFKAIRIPDNSGWCILYVTNFPEQEDYYQMFLKDNTKKIEFGLQQGVFTRVIENGIVKIEDKDIIKTILQTKAAGRAINFIYWSPNAPSVISNLVIMESKIDDEIKKQINNVCNSLQIN